MVMQVVRASVEAPKVERTILAGTLDDLVRAHAARKSPIPVAVTLAIFEDLCSRAEVDPRPTEGRVPTAADVRLSGDGVASMTLRFRDPVRDLGTLLRQALSSGIGDQEIPPAALPILNTAMDDDPHVRHASVHALRCEVRSVLGVPATKAEVAATLARIPRGSIAGERLPPPQRKVPKLDSDIRLPPSLTHVPSELPAVDVMLSSLPPLSADGTIGPVSSAHATVPSSVMGLAERAARAEVAFRDPTAPPPLPKPNLALDEDEPSFAPVLRRQRRTQAAVALAAAASLGAAAAYFAGLFG